MRMRSLCVALVLVLGASAVAVGQDDDAWATALRARAEAYPVEARLTFRELAACDATADRRAAAAEIALNVFPYATGNELAAPLILKVLRENRSHPEAWQLGYGLQRRVVDGLDVENGEPFLRAMVTIYPDYARFKYSLADLLYGSGRPDEADAIYTEIVRDFPDDTRARYILALIRELEGNALEAIEIYDTIIARGLDLKAYRYKVTLLWDVLADYDAADEALAAGFAAVDAAPPGRVRDEVRAGLEWEQQRLADRREERVKLAEASARTDQILIGVVAVWIVVLGGGLAFLRRRRLL